ncbi:DinB family protein [Algoriphagus sp. D3-2-R+10]|uniref:DinB family protein n=1 Tax=Algoriphagus aurantiacus TaxID=3103948 RepID=UPI002B3F7EEA|nr:DinB family protein [Algoriphagus sp. D3-2-R+10]MEB2775210.1 DinB family protein [Algoriphagus sp. D3-2-R+10]
MKSQPEVWLRGPIPGYPPKLQPVVHAILQAQEDIHKLMRDFPTDLLWERPAGMASPGFHLQHISGVIDRMITYAKAETLDQLQFEYLKKEGLANTSLTTEILVANLDNQISEFLDFLYAIDVNTLQDFRGVGRAQLPSTVGGLLFHAAEHCQRHFGQLLVTVKILIAR